MSNFSDLLNETIIEIKGAEKGNDYIVFTLSNGVQYKMYHSQDCCESVRIEDICGDVGDLLNTPLRMAEEESSGSKTCDKEKQHRLYEVMGVGCPCQGDGSHTWTFYKLGTINGYVTIRWLGESNGYYSESVDFEKAVEEKEE